MLGDLRQAHRYSVGGRPGATTCLLADRFLSWAVNSRLAPSDLTLAKHRRGTGASPPLHKTSRFIGSYTSRT